MKLSFFRSPFLSGPLTVVAGFLLTFFSGPVQAGDILRGGAAPAAAAQRAAAATQTTAAAAAQARSTARDNLARTTRAVQAMQAMQNSARFAAVTAATNHAGLNPNAPGNLPNVPNGLGAGGLQVDPGVGVGTAVWSGANLPTQSSANGRTTVNIRQTQQTALLSWETYNVGRQTTLRYDQPGGSDTAKWVAFNRVNDPSSSPSQILGSIQAPGQIYVINRNGIIFGAGSQVNVGTLVASSLPVNTNLIERGLLNNPDAQFLFSGLAIPAGSQGTPGFTPDAPNPAIGRYGDVTVQAGATIASPTTDAKSGGRVMLVGPSVNNAGSISTPDGQTVLAAGMQVGIAAHSSSDPSLRGLDVYIGSVTPSGGGAEVGEVTQGGIINAPRGNITLAGRDIRQNGALESSTSVSLNGRIDVLASYDAISNSAFNPANSAVGAPFLTRQTGTVRFGAGSVSRILPELASSETAIGRELALRSQINVVGRAIQLGRNSSLQAPSGSIRLNAGEWRLLGLGGTSPNARFVQSTGQVYLDSDSLIDVAGSTGVSASILQHILDLELRGAELASSPLQRGGVLRDQQITVDFRNEGTYAGRDWLGTPLADATGFAGIIQRTVGEFTAAGGQVSISAGESVVMQTGSRVDVSGGFIKFKGATVETTRLRLQGGLIDIKNATPDRQYDGIYTGTTFRVSERWGVNEEYTQPLALTGERFEADYIEGAAGGSIDIVAPSMALDGDLTGRTVDGPRQRAAANLSSLRLSFTSVDASIATFPTIAPTPPAITFRNGGNQQSAGPFTVDLAGDPAPLSAPRLASVVLSPDLLEEDGFGNLTVENPDGNITVPERVALTTKPGGSVALIGSNITVEGRVIAPGGTLTFEANNLPLGAINTANITRVRPAPIAGRGNFVLGRNGVLSTAGLVVDDRANGSELTPQYLAGGNLSIGGFNVRLTRGSVADVSGGAQASTRGRITYGNAGTLSIGSGRDLTIGEAFGGSLVLGGTLKGYSGTRGGTLNMSALAFQVGGGTAPAGVHRVEPEFFSTGGFAAFALTGMGLPTSTPDVYRPGINLVGGTRIRAVAESWLAVPNPVAGTGLELIPFEKPEGLRSPVSLSFNSTGATDSFNSGFIIARGDLVMGQGASIVTDGGGNVSLRGETATILGAVRTPGGNITVSGANAFPLSGQALTTVYIGSGASLSAAGKPVIREGRNEWREGTIFGGGNISVSGNIVAERGAVMNVSGSTGILDLPVTYRGVNATPVTGLRGQPYVPVRTSTNGGTINLTGGQTLYSDATLYGSAGGASANGGTLNVSSGRFIAAGTAFTSADSNLVVRQQGNVLPDSGFPRGVGQAVRDGAGAALPGIGNFAADRFMNGGFAALSLGGNVQFDGPVRIEAPASIRAASGGVINANGNVTLAAPYVSLGRPFRAPALDADVVVGFTQTDASGIVSPLFLAPVTGVGRLTVLAETIDLGDLSLQGIGRADLNAGRGDIRGNGTFQIAGDLVLRAGQIYPTTLTEFNLFAYDPAGGSGSVTILGGRNRDLPLSAGGALSIYASTINQSGTLRAPIGSINLGWDGTGAAPVNPIAGTSIAAPVTVDLTLGSGSVTSVAALDPGTGRGVVIPFGISFDGNSWIDPAGNDITVGGVPAKEVNLAGADVTTEAGSVIDIRGGGDLYAYRWVEGNGGKVDILAASNAFAVIPGYGFDYAPYAPFNSNSSAVNLQGETGYVNSTLRIGDTVTLGASDGLAGGTYTLLPARYALLPGAVLVTPTGGAPVGTRLLDDGSSIVSGYRANDLNADRVGRTTMQRFEVASAEVVRQRAEYIDFYANAFLRKAAASRDFAVPRLPSDSGYLSFAATNTMAIRGEVLSNPRGNGRGSLVDISSSGDILINEDGRGGRAGVLALGASMLNRLNAESLLIGGTRSQTSAGSAVSVTTTNISINNPVTALAGSDFIFAANEEISVADGVTIRGTGNTAVDAITLGSADLAGSGDGALLRVSGSTFAPVTRFGVGNSASPRLGIGEGVLLTGGSVTADSTFATNLDPSARIVAPVVALNSGQISIQLDDPGALNPTSGLVLSGEALGTIQEVTRDLTLLSYSSLDLYGTGTVGTRTLERLTILAPAIRGFNQGGSDFRVVAQNLSIESTTGRTFPAPPAGPLNGRLVFDADQITLGRNDVRVDGFAGVELGADSRILVSGTGSFAAAGSVDLVTPLLTGAGAARHEIRSGGALRLLRPAGATAGAEGGLGASVTLTGASLEVNSDAIFSSGEITLRATTGDLLVGNADRARLDAGGTSRAFLDVVRYTSGGTVNLSADAGDIALGALSTVDVSAPAGGGNAGLLNVNSPLGAFDLSGAIVGSAGAGGRSGSFTLDAATVTGNDLAATDAILNAGQFNGLRSYRIRTGDFDISGLATARDYRAYADAGSITVSGTIDVSGVTAGSIELSAHRNLTLASGALLDASAQQFSAAGKGGAISLGAGASRNGVIDAGAMLNLEAGSNINLLVDANQPSSPSRGQFTGTLHLRAPQTAGFNDVQISAIGSDIVGASAITVEGYRLYDRSGTGTLDNALLAAIQADGNAFLGSGGSASGNYAAMLNRLTGLQPGLDLILTPGAEIINTSGSLTLGSTVSTEASDWNLAGLRFGPRSAAGNLTLRAADNLNLFNAISDGFAGGPSLWLSPLVAHNALLPANSQSWSYRMSAGSDFAAADTRAVEALEDLTADPLRERGMIRLGKNAGSATATGGSNAVTSSVIGNRFQVIRTGSGDIDINAGRSFQFLNPFATVYTAGTQVANPNSIFAPNDFVTPILTGPIGQGALGAVQQTYPAQYAMAGGNVSIDAGENIERKTQNNSGLVDDSSRQLPNNWLYRRGYVGPNGNYGQVTIGAGFITFNDPAASTSWWVDHSNFFQSVGALGGGNVSLVAGNEVRNVDAVIPTTARAPRGVPNASTLVETGGGDLLVRSGGDISGGVYYVERGVGRLEAGGSVTTNAARSPSLGTIQNLNNPAAAQFDPLTWMPTTLFLGRSTFDVSARGDVLLGPMANAFLLPQGVNNRFWYKAYFSTYGEEAAVHATSLGGDVTFRNAVTLPQRASSTDTLRAWLETQQVLATGSAGAAFTQPWLRLAETSVDPFAALMRLAPPTLVATSLGGDINLAGNMTLFPSASGQLELIAAGQVSAYQPTGRSNILIPGQSIQTWTASTINVSDANPAAIPGVTNPFNYFGLVGSSTNANNSTRAAFLEPIARFFTDSGSTTGSFGVSTTKQALHDGGPLHRNDAEPLRVYALEGNLSGLTLFSPKESRLYASRDITDIAFYLQNLAGSDTSLVTAGRDIVPYNASSQLRNDSLATGNAPASGQLPLAGDIHIGGPGAIQVLAGRNIDLGTGATNADGSGTGILSIGNIRNPFLPFAGADLIIGAGIGSATSLTDSRLNVPAFINEYVKGAGGRAYLDELGVNDFNSLGDEEQAAVAMEVFYLVLRDAGRDFNNEKSPGFGNYDNGFEAIKTLFGSANYSGDILTQGRNIRTQNGGNISLLAPGGGLTLANTTLGNPLVPPGIVTESGGNVSIFTDGNVDIGVGRIFTLRGGDMVIWSSTGDIAAGVASKTVQSAPPTRVLIDPQSGAVETDLAGLATGGGIGVLATVAGVKPGNVDLIAPRGVIDAGDAGIRVTGNINLAATQVVNATNIAAGGSASGAPSAPAASSPSVGGLSSASTAAAAASSTAMDANETTREQPETTEITEEVTLSVITVEVLGYGGGGAVEEEEEEE